MAKKTLKKIDDADSGDANNSSDVVGGSSRLCALLRIDTQTSMDDVCDAAADLIEKMRAVNKPASVFARK